MTRIQRTTATPFDGELMWSVLLEMALCPERFVEGVVATEGSNLHSRGFTRTLDAGDRVLEEEVLFDPLLREVRFTLIGHPVYTGSTLQKVIGDTAAKLEFQLDWRRRDGAPLDAGLGDLLAEAQRHAVAAAAHRILAAEAEYEAVGRMTAA